MAEILAHEAELTEASRLKYGPYLATSMHCCALLTSAFAKVEEDRFLFVAMHSQVCKHTLLATLSNVRLHKVQASLNLRQVLESAQRACFFLANPMEGVTDKGDHFEVSEKGVKQKTHRFFDQHMGPHAKAFRDHKDLINKTDAHASLLNTGLNLLHKDGPRFSFFDREEEPHVRVGLWSVINTTIGVLDAYHLANGLAGGLTFADDFVKRFDAALGIRDRLHTELQEAGVFPA